MKTEATSVLNGRFPDIRTTEPNSPSARPSARPAPETIAGARLGRITRRKIVGGRAPSDAAASSASRSSSISTGCTERTTNGSVTNSRAARTAQRVNAMLMPAGPFGPYRAKSVRPATIVGSANGRSISAFTKRLPGNSSRTSTQAISVPAAALTSATAIDMPIVSLNAETAWFELIAFQKPSRPRSVERATTAAKGSSTTTLSHATETQTSTGGRGRPRTRPTGGPRVTASLLSRDPERLLDLRHDPLVGVEEPVVDGAPATELLDLEELRRSRELRLVDERLLDRSVALRGEDPLPLVGAQERDERLRLDRVLAGGGDR